MGEKFEKMEEKKENEEYEIVEKSTSNF